MLCLLLVLRSKRAAELLQLHQFIQFLSLCQVIHGFGAERGRSARIGALTSLSHGPKVHIVIVFNLLRESGTQSEVN